MQQAEMQQAEAETESSYTHMTGNMVSMTSVKSDDYTSGNMELRFSILHFDSY
jgi:hypothetical protein